MAILELGLSQQAFFDIYFEKRFFFKAAAISEFRVTLPEIDRAIYSWEPTDPTLRLYAKGPVSQGEYLESWEDIDGRRVRIVPERIQVLLSRGATLVLDRIERKIPSIGKICQEVGKLTGQRVGANAYVAFGGDGTFGKHWDTHDVLAIQLMGRKRWKVFEPTLPLPLPGQTSKDRKAECPDTPIFDVEMNEGDALYLPRGWWHEALPFPNEKTVHIAIGVHTLRAIDYLLWFSERVMPEFLPSRVTVRPGANNQETLQHLLTILEQELDGQQHIDKFLQECRPPEFCIADSFLPLDFIK